MEKQLIITLKGEKEHADNMTFSLNDEEIRDFFGDVTALLVLDPDKYRCFKIALQSCVQTIEMLQNRKINSSENIN
jgi:hypothetical protein